MPGPALLLRDGVLRRECGSGLRTRSNRCDAASYIIISGESLLRKRPLPALSVSPQVPLGKAKPTTTSSARILSALHNSPTLSPNPASTSSHNATEEKSIEKAKQTTANYALSLQEKRGNVSESDQLSKSGVLRLSSSSHRISSNCNSRYRDISHKGTRHNSSTEDKFRFSIQHEDLIRSSNFIQGRSLIQVCPLQPQEFWTRSSQGHHHRGQGSLHHHQSRQGQS